MKINYLLNNQRKVAFYLGTKIGVAYFTKISSYDELVRRMRIYFECDSSISHHQDPSFWADEVAYDIYTNFQSFGFVSSDYEGFTNFLDYVVIGSIEFGDDRIGKTIGELYRAD